MSSDPVHLPRPTNLLIVNRDEWGSRSLESILRPNGYAILRAYTGEQALTILDEHPVDIVLLAFNVPDVDGVVLCSTVRDLAVGGVPRPILVMSATRLSRQRRLAALRAGAWTILPAQFDAEELLLQLDIYREAKRYADRATTSGLLDLELGCYNASGLRKRVSELISEALRNEMVVTCMVLHVAGTGPFNRPSPELLRSLTSRINRHLRQEDVLGRLDRDRLVIAAALRREESAADLQARLTKELKDTIAGWGGRSDVAIEVGARVARAGEHISATDLVASAHSVTRRMNGNHGTENPAH